MLLLVASAPCSCGLAWCDPSNQRSSKATSLTASGCRGAAPMRVRRSRTTLRSFACAGPQARGTIKLCVYVTEVIWIFHYEIQAINEMEPAPQVRFQAAGWVSEA